MSNNPQCYDLIGDIHGEADALHRLLKKIGYTDQQGVYRHSHRQVIFLGDFIDRGPAQREVIDIVKPMVEEGAAISVMGNHEFNAIAFHTRRDDEGYLREHTPKNIQQHQAFLDAYPDLEERSTIIRWFSSLPLWLDLEQLRVVHACWDSRGVSKLLDNYGSPYLSQEMLIAASESHTWEYETVEILLKGKEIRLPLGQSFEDKDGNRRHNIRIRWWGEFRSYRDAFIGPESALTHIPDDPIEGDHLIVYGHEEKPVFLGHYWLEPPIRTLADNIACLDYSVAKPGGQLVAYRWDGEQKLSIEKFVAVRR